MLPEGTEELSQAWMPDVSTQRKGTSDAQSKSFLDQANGMMSLLEGYSNQKPESYIRLFFLSTRWEFTKT